MDKSEKTMDVLRQVVIISLSSVITGGHIGPVLAMSAHHKLDGKQNVQNKFAQLRTYSFLESTNLELTNFTNLELAKVPKLADSSDNNRDSSNNNLNNNLKDQTIKNIGQISQLILPVKTVKFAEISGAGLPSDRPIDSLKFSATKFHNFNLSAVADSTDQPLLEKKAKASILDIDNVKSASSPKIFPDSNTLFTNSFLLNKTNKTLPNYEVLVSETSLTKSAKSVNSFNTNLHENLHGNFHKNLHKNNLLPDLRSPEQNYLTVNKPAKSSIVEPMENIVNNSSVTSHQNYEDYENTITWNKPVKFAENNLNSDQVIDNVILTGVTETGVTETGVTETPIKTVRDMEKVTTKSSVLLNNDQNTNTIVAQAEGETDANSYPPPVPNGTLQTNPPAEVNPVPNPLYLPNTPGAVQLQGSVSLTLQQAIDIARRNNTTLQSSEVELVKSKERVKQAQAALLPQLDLQSTTEWRQSANGDIQERAARKRARKEGVDFPEDNTQDTPNFTFDTSLSLSYDTGVDGGRAARIRATEKEVELRELEFERLTEEVRLQTSADYFELQESDGRVKIGEAAVANAKKSLSDAEALERAGVGTRFDVLQSQVKLANEQQNLTNALRDQRVAKRQLAQTLNVSQTVEITAADPIEPAGSWRFSLDETIVQAFNNRAELEQQLVRRDLNDEEKKIALSAIRPRLVLFASYDVLFLAPNDDNVYLPRGWGDGYSIGARMSWNLFDGGSAKSQARQSDLDKQLSEVRFEETRNDVRIQVERAFFELEASFENIGTAELGLEQAKEALRLARLRFQAGVGTQLEVINQETDLTRSQISLLVAIINYNRSLSALQRAVSNLPDNNLSDAP